MSLQQPEDGVGHVLDAADLIADVEDADAETLLQEARNGDNRVRESAERAADEVDAEARDLVTAALGRVRKRGDGK